MELADSIWRAVSGQVRQFAAAIALQRAQRQDLMDMAARAQQEGAIEGKRFGPAVCFYRLSGDRVECCFAEYNPSTQRYGWIWEPPDWHEAPAGIPLGATPISEIARRGI
jgi:hypothetical protein